VCSRIFIITCPYTRMARECFFCGMRAILVQTFPFSPWHIFGDASYNMKKESL